MGKFKDSLTEQEIDELADEIEQFTLSPTTEAPTISQQADDEDYQDDQMPYDFWDNDTEINKNMED